MERYARFALFLLCLIIVLPLPLQASKYSPPGLYDTEYLVLENGLRVVLNAQEGPHNASFRLVVKVGTLDFPHGKRETPHFLEHLLFTGTSKHSEEELENLVKSYGGSWNAVTDEKVTIFEMDLYSGYAREGLILMSEIVTDSQIQPEKVEMTREVLLREMGGKPSKLKKWLYRRGIGKSAFAKAYEALLPGKKYRRDRIETAEDITREEIFAAYRRYYAPGNMMLIVVGDFDSEKMLKWIDGSFGKMEPGGVREQGGKLPPYPSGPVEVSGTLSPVVGTDATVGIMFRTEGKASPDYPGLRVLGEYMNRRMYEYLRIKKGIAYSPGAWFSAGSEYGMFHILADVDIGKMDDALRNIWEVIEESSKGEVKPEEIKKVKRDLLLGMTRAYQTNAEKADYYARSYFEVEGGGKFTSMEDLLEKVKEKDVASAAKKYLGKRRAVIFRSEPTITYSQLVTLIMVLIISLGLVLLLFIRRRRKKRRRGLEFHGLLRR